MSSHDFSGSPVVAYRDPSSPFTIHLTLGCWEAGPAGVRQAVDITIASGALQDADKGTFPLAGVILRMRAAAQIEPVAVINPGALSELQQVGLLDAVSSHLNASSPFGPES